MQAFLRNLDDACRFQRLPHVLRVLLLTLQRRSELALAEWREFDPKAKTWTIPDAHAKTVEKWASYLAGLRGDQRSV